MWELGTCYLFGSGVKKDATKGLLIRDCAVETGSLSPEQKESMISTQNIFKSFEVDERSHYTIFTAFKHLFTIKKPEQKAERQVKDDKERD